MYTFFRDLAESAVEFLGAVVGELLGALVALVAAVLSWLVSGLDLVVRSVVAGLLPGFEAVFSQLPVPSFVSGFGAAWAAVPWGHVAYFLAPFEIQYGATVLFGSWLLKFSLRVFPIIGVMFRAPST